MRLRATLVWVALGCCATALAADPKPLVRFELVTQGGLAPGASQKWYETFSALGVTSLQIRSATSKSEAAEIKQEGTRAAPVYKVVGIVSSDNGLHLPGGKFSTGDSAKLRKWIDSLADEGPEAVTETRGAFGLLAKQLVEVNDDLRQPVDFETKGLAANVAVEKIAGKLANPLSMEPAARRALAEIDIEDELRGLSCGTALAAIVRPAGVALRPERPIGGTLQYRVAAAQAGRDAWPVGWPSKKRPNQVLPLLFENLNVEIKEIPVSEALAAVQERLKVKLLFDRNAMALHGADPAKAKADVPDKRMSYSQILNKILGQAKLKYELRVDEAELPFLWITTIKPAA